MTPSRALLRLLLAILTLGPALATAQIPGGLSREQMWPAPTAADWKKPCLIKFQRNWDDAVEVSKKSGRPILICINMDGEIASEHYAGIRYRQKDIAALYQPYVAVIASVYRHTPRDHDEHGHRVLCPRFGSVTCGEHIAIEPLIFKRFCDGQRVAPRHIMVELDGKETYDVFYAFDTASVFSAIRDGIAKRERKPKPEVRGDRSLVERVASRDVVDREAVERGYLQGDQELRRALLNAAIAQGDQMPIEVLRLALHGFDSQQLKWVKDALARAKAPNSVGLIAEALQVPMNRGERDALIAALGVLGKTSAKARRLASVHRGLSSKSKLVDSESWATAMGGASYAPAPDPDAIAARLEEQEKLRLSRDPKERLALAEAFLERAIARRDEAKMDPRLSRALFRDAQETALEAEKLGARGWRLNCVLAVAAHYLNDTTEAETRAEAAVAELPDDPQGWNTMIVLSLFGKMRHDRIVAAVKSKKPWPGAWLSDMHAAETLLARHRDALEVQLVSHYDFLVWLGAEAKARSYLQISLSRFPDSWALHARLRQRILKEKGVSGLESVYAALMSRDGAPRNLPWFAGYASLVAAEFQRRRGRDEDAVGSYDRAIALYEQAIGGNPDIKPTADHYIAMALGAKARLSLEARRWKRSVDLLVQSFRRCPGAAATLDGLNLSAVDTAKMLRARLREEKLDLLASRLEAALARLDPEMLDLPAFEGQGPGRRPRRRR